MISANMLSVLTDPENQPHQYVGKPELLANKCLRELYKETDNLDFAVRQANNGYILEVGTPVREIFVLRSAEELASYIANRLLQLPH